MKINCIYHLSQPITNFCQDRHCLMPLCPQCISEHTQYHEDERTRPHYSTIYEVLADVHTQITNCIDMLNQDKSRNGCLIINIQTVSDKIRQKVCAAKQLVYRSIEQSFALLQKQLNKQLQKFHEQKSIYSLAKSQKQDKLLIEHLDQLQGMRGALKSDRCLSNLIYFLREKSAQVEQFHHDFSVYLHVNQNYQPKLEINTQSVYSIQALISKIIKTNNTVPNKSKKQQRVLQVFKQNSTYHPHPNAHMHTVLNPNPHLLTLHNPSPLKPASQRLKQRHNIPFVESEVKNYSPHLSRLKYSKEKDKERKVRVDGEYEQLSRKVALMREENDRLSKILGKG